MPTIRPALRPFTVIGWSLTDVSVCPDCLRSAVPVTGERVSHTCRRNRVHLTGPLRQVIVGLWGCHTGPKSIAAHLKLNLSTVMAVISGDADDDAVCPACEASKRGDSRIALPIYAGDASMAEELCTHCDRHLLTIASEHADRAAAEVRPEHSVTAAGHPALRFEQRPSPTILQALEVAGWRWDPGERLWFDPTDSAALPDGVPVPASPRNATARFPIIRRRCHVEGAAAP